MARVVLVTAAEYYPQAKCEVCVRDWLPSPTARAEAKDHVKLTGHRVTVTVIRKDTYGRD